MVASLVPFSFGETRLCEAAWIDGKPYFTRRAIGEWLGYNNPRIAISKIVNRNPHLRDPRWATVTNLVTVENGRIVRREQEVYDLIGLQLIINKSNQTKAIKFQVAAAQLVVAYLNGEISYNPTKKLQKCGHGRFFSPERHAVAEELRRVMENELWPECRKTAFLTKFARKHGLSFTTVWRMMKKIERGEDPAMLGFGTRGKTERSEALIKELKLIYSVDPEPWQRGGKKEFINNLAERHGVSVYTALRLAAECRPAERKGENGVRQTH